MTHFKHLSIAFFIMCVLIPFIAPASASNISITSDDLVTALNITKEMSSEKIIVGDIRDEFTTNTLSQYSVSSSGFVYNSSGNVYSSAGGFLITDPELSGNREYLAEITPSSILDWHVSGIVLKYNDSSNYVSMWIFNDTAGSDNLVVRRCIGGSCTNHDAYIMPEQFWKQEGKTYYMRVRLEDGQIKGKAWIKGEDSEPAGWEVNWTDDTSLNDSIVGLERNAGTGNATFDNLWVRQVGAEYGDYVTRGFDFANESNSSYKPTITNFNSTDDGTASILKVDASSDNSTWDGYYDLTITGQQGDLLHQSEDWLNYIKYNGRIFIYGNKLNTSSINNITLNDNFSIDYISPTVENTTIGYNTTSTEVRIIGSRNIDSVIFSWEPYNGTEWFIENRTMSLMNDTAANVTLTNLSDSELMKYRVYATNGTNTIQGIERYFSIDYHLSYIDTIPTIRRWLWKFNDSGYYKTELTRNTTVGWIMYGPIWRSVSDHASITQRTVKRYINTSGPLGWQYKDCVVGGNACQDVDGFSIEESTLGYVSEFPHPYLEPLIRYNKPGTQEFITLIGEDAILPSGFIVNETLGYAHRDGPNYLTDVICIDNSYINMCVDINAGGAIVNISNMTGPNMVNLESNGRYIQSAYYSDGPYNSSILDPYGGPYLETYNPDWKTTSPYVWGWNPTQAGGIYGQKTIVNSYWSNATRIIINTSYLQNWNPENQNRTSDLRMTITYDLEVGEPVVFMNQTIYHDGSTNHTYWAQETPSVHIDGNYDRWVYNDTATNTLIYENDWAQGTTTLGPGVAMFTAVLNDADYGIGVWNEKNPQYSMVRLNFSGGYTTLWDRGVSKMSAMPYYTIAATGIDVDDEYRNTTSNLAHLYVGNITAMDEYYISLNTLVPTSPKLLTGETVNATHALILWTSGRNTDTFNFSCNGTWTNGSASLSNPCAFNVGDYANVTIYGWNITESNLGPPANLSYLMEIINYIPPVVVIDSVIMDDYWKNITFSAGVGNITDSYNISRNGTWYNGTSINLNTTTSAHGWINDTIYAWNSSGTGTLSSSVVNNTQMDNNAISISGINAIYNLNEGDTLSIDANYSDADNDAGTFADNATEWNINTSTGEVSWITSDGDQGTYHYQINASDGYGSTDEYNFTVIVGDNSPVITQYCNNVNGCGQASLSTTINNTITFNVTINQTANISWSVAGSEEQNTTNTTFIREFLSAGPFNVTATGYNANGTSNTIYTIVNVGQLLATETAVNGVYTLNITHTPTTSPTWVNYTTTNTILLNADFNNTHSFSTNNSNATLQISLPNFNISTGNVTIGEDSFYTVVIDYFYPPTNLTSSPDINHIDFNWDNVTNADYYNIYELEESAPYINTTIILDGVKDSVYDDYAHAFIISTPNQISPDNYETIYWFRNDTHLIGYADGFDADSLNNDDSFKLVVDNTGNNLTTDDRQFILNEGSSTSAKRWSGSAWLPQSTSAEGFVVGSGGGGAIQYEMIIPLSEMSGFVDGVTAKFMMERKCTSLNPDISTYFPETLINDTDATLWATAKLTIGEEYVYIDNSTTSDYNVTNLTPFTWYKHNITVVNGSSESGGVFSTDVTLDIPKYTVSGYIKDINGAPIPNANVWSQNGIVKEHNISNATGYYIGHHFHNGTYRIFANATGYATNNTTEFTVAGANITNKNVTLIESVSDNLVNFTFTNLAYTTPIKEYQSTTITVDINDSDGTITNAIIKIHGTNHTMQYISGDQWRYIYSSGIITNHYITNIYATDNASGTNSTTYTTDYISILSRAGAGGGGGGMVLPPQIEEEEDVLEVIIPTNVSDAVDFVENVTKSITNIISGDSFSMLRINTNPFQPSYAKTIMISGVVDATSTDPNVDVGAVNNEVIVITRPPLDNSLYFKYDTSIDIALDTGAIEHRDYSVMVIDLMAYIPVKEFVMPSANPYIFKPSGVSSVEGVRMWWIMLIVLCGVIILGRKRGKK